ncbi:hypothetical protein ACVGVM_06900 [Pseudonocardia bannensis]|uniref:Bacterial Pleckstrin homology domain-containing protein n=1 Tax=Pseudonocardia bannensis TaxID=630973 RepID=A0A848DR92_9PSEU|nr:hypothetical protein [Pseudonocardia bannensis]NMH95019.1 hypothetical protein [Pseudonocardia bannensis]
MPTAHVTSDKLEVTFSRGEKIAGLIRDVHVPLSAVRDAVVVPDGFAAARGVRAPGLAIPGVRKIGTWRRHGEKALVAVRRGEPAVRISLSGERYDTLLLGVADPAGLVARLGSRAG